MTESPQRPAPPPDGPKMTADRLVGGVVLGFVASWMFYLFTAVTAVTAFGDEGSPSPGPWLELVVLVLPPVVMLALLVPRRTRRAGAGLLLGIALGSVVGAGACVGVLQNVAG